MRVGPGPGILSSDATMDSLQVATPEAAAAVEGVSPLTAGKRKAAKALTPSELAAPASAVAAVAAKPEKKQMGLLSFFSKKAAWQRCGWRARG